MAAICPNCHLPEMIAYVINDTGVHPFPCLECSAGPFRSTPHGQLTGATACATDGCQGSVRDEYQYDAKGRLSKLTRIKCQFCGTDKTGVINAGSTPERVMPDPRLPGFEGRRVRHG
ncbi:hypothetical protein GCM10010300_15450 [Streptomyces olivaceoviridis]|uniref:hypothetical protein n=1 Tax=Streptomyces olivaceoviridis TaxID=1921 RepID=UPI0016732E92|nr:hypothetical protein [Streptomyces olivaceoviridis]GGY72995.1 hypothetical protein GCM10010300_15450 [Streptomyces olivaceoviridis]